MAAHRYWRVRFSAATGGSNIWLSELEWLRAGTGNIVAPTRSTASSSYSADYKVNTLFDGIKNAGDGWASSAVACWVASDFTNPVDLEAVRVFNAWQTGSAGELPVLSAVYLEYSDNNTNWTEQSRVAVGSNFPGGDFTVGVNRLTGPNRQARYWRLSMIEGYSESLTLSRLELWNSTNRVCQAATLTANIPAYVGSVSTLKGEGTVGCTFLYNNRKAFPEFTWDAGSGNTMDVLLVRFAGPSRQEFIRYFNLSYSSDGVNWTILSTSQKYSLAFPGVNTLTEKPAAGTFFVPKIEAIAELDPFKVDNTAKTVNLDIGDRQPRRAIIPIASNTRQYLEIKLPDDNTYPWMIGVLRPDVFTADSLGINDTGTYGGAVVFRNDSSFYNFGTNVGTSNSITPGFTANSVIGFAIDTINGTIIINSSSGKTGTRDTRYIGEGGYLVISREYNVSTIFANQERLFTVNFGQNAFVRQPPAGYAGAFGFLYKYESTSITAAAAHSVSAAVDGVAGDITFGDFVNVSHISKQAKYEQYCGKGYIKNRVYTKGNPNNPAKKKIALFDMATNIFVAETVSDTTGLFEFKFLDEKLKYVAMALDELGQWEPACTGPLTPSIMPMVTV